MQLAVEHVPSIVGLYQHLGNCFCCGNYTCTAAVAGNPYFDQRFINNTAVGADFTIAVLGLPLGYLHEDCARNLQWPVLRSCNRTRRHPQFLHSCRRYILRSFHI